MMEFLTALCRSGPASCKTGGECTGSRRRKSRSLPSPPTHTPTAGVAAKKETKAEDSEGSDPELWLEEITMFRAVAARPNDLSQDLPDITLATMKWCSKMSRPSGQDLKNMKRVGEFLIGKSRLGSLVEWRANPIRPC